MNGRSVLFASLALCWLLSLGAWGAENPAEKITYTDHVRPILREHCFNCHNQNKATNDLALDSYERLRKGGASGEAIQPGDAENSYLWLLVSHKGEPHMPPNQDKIPAAKLDVIKQWILAGALKDSGWATLSQGQRSDGDEASNLEAYVAEERTLRGSYIGSAVPARDIPRYIEMYQRGKLPVDRLMGERLALADINRGFGRLAAGQAMRDVVLI